MFDDFDTQIQSDELAPMGWSDDDQWDDDDFIDDRELWDDSVPGEGFDLEYSDEDSEWDYDEAVEYENDPYPEFDG